MLEEKLGIVKSNKLIEAIYEDFFTIREQKIIFKVCSLIKQEDEAFADYTISIKEFSEMMELKGKPKYSDYQRITENLLSKVISIKEESGLLQTHWFSKVRYNYGDGTIDFSFPYELKPHLLKLQENFTPLDLKYILKLNSTHSIRLYEIMRSLSFRHNALIDLQDLKKMLGLTNSYAEYSNFKLRVLNPSKKEISTKTDITFEYEEVKKGRKVVAVRFFIKSTQNRPIAIKEQDLFESTLIDLLKGKYEALNEKNLNNWIESAKEVYGESDFEKELMEFVDEALNVSGMDSYIAFITHILKEKNKLTAKGMDHRLADITPERRIAPKNRGIQNQVKTTKRNS